MKWWQRGLLDTMASSALVLLVALLLVFLSAGVICVIVAVDYLLTRI